MDTFVNLFSPDIFKWVVVPLLIMLARICDVAMGTVRIMLIGKGYRNVAPFIGFFEVLVWIIAVSQIMQHLDEWIYYFSFALGFALGTFVGMKIEERLSLGQVVIRVITNSSSTELMECLKQNNFNFTIVDAEGKFGPVKILFMITKRHLLRDAIHLIETHNPNVFFSVEDVKFVKGTLPGGRNPIFKNPFYALRPNNDKTI